MLMTFLKALLVMYVVYLVIDFLYLISPLFLVAVLFAGIFAVIWNGLNDTGICEVVEWIFE